MKQVFTSQDSAQVGLMQSVLETAGIACEVRNDMVARMIPAPLFAPQLWIVNDDDQVEAEQVIEAFQAAPSTGGEEAESR